MIGGGMIAAAPSQAAPKAPKSWMTAKEFKKLKKGMTIAQVRAIVGSKGRQKRITKWEEEGYCDVYASDLVECLVYVPPNPIVGQLFVWRTAKNVSDGGYVTFENGRMDFKRFRNKPLKPGDEGYRG